MLFVHAMAYAFPEQAWSMAGKVVLPHSFSHAVSAAPAVAGRPGMLNRSNRRSDAVFGSKFGGGVRCDWVVPSELVQVCVMLPSEFVTLVGVTQVICGGSAKAAGIEPTATTAPPTMMAPAASAPRATVF